MVRLVKYNSEPAFSNLFNRFFEGELGNLGNRPATNIKESEEAFELDILVPGYKKEEINIEIDERILSISAKQDENNEDQEAWLKEFSIDAFNRSFRLPKNIDIEAIKAEQVDGILHIYIPKLKDVQKMKKLIEIA